MNREYFISVNGQSQGPYTFEQLGQFDIQPNTLIWHKELRNWTEAAFLKEMELYVGAKNLRLSSSGFDQVNRVSYTRDNQYVIVTTPTERIHYRFANFGERFVAGLVDGLIMIIPSFFFYFLAPWLYFALTQGGNKQATVGQTAMNIMVMEIEGRKVDFGRATGRYFARFLSALTLGIGYLMFFWTDKKQTLHDNLAGTIVVKEVRRERIGTT